MAHFCSNLGGLRDSTLEVRFFMWTVGFFFENLPFLPVYAKYENIPSCS